MFTRWQKRKRKSPAFDDARETDVQFWQRAMKQLGQLAERIKMALRRSQALNEGLAREKDRIPW